MLTFIICFSDHVMLWLNSFCITGPAGLQIFFSAIGYIWCLLHIPLVIKNWVNTITIRWTAIFTPHQCQTNRMEAFDFVFHTPIRLVLFEKAYFQKHLDTFFSKAGFGNELFWSDTNCTMCYIFWSDINCTMCYGHVM